MVTLLRSWSLRCFVASLTLTTIAAAADDTEGVVRLNSKPVAASAEGESIVRGQSPYIEPAQYYSDCPVEYSYGPSAGYGVSDGYPLYDELCARGRRMRHCDFVEAIRFKGQVWHAQLAMKRQHLHQEIKEDCQEKGAWARCKFGYFCPSGCCGKGCPPIGHYGMVYPLDPGYFDQRDGAVYAAPGYGGPVSVPLAPVVNHTYNYGWGIPSSRLTPVSHPATAAPAAMIPSPYVTAPVAR